MTEESNKLPTISTKAQDINLAEKRKAKSQASHPITSIRKTSTRIADSSRPIKRFKDSTGLTTLSKSTKIFEGPDSDSDSDSDDNIPLAQSCLDAKQKPVMNHNKKTTCETNTTYRYEEDSDIEFITKDIDSSHSDSALTNKLVIESSKSKQCTSDPTSILKDDLPIKNLIPSTSSNNNQIISAIIPSNQIMSNTTQTPTKDTDLLNSIKDVLTKTFTILVDEAPPLQSQRQALQTMYDSAAQLADNEPGEAIYEAELIEKSRRLNQSNLKFESLLNRLVEPLSETMMSLSFGPKTDLNYKFRIDQLDQKVNQQKTQLEIQQKQIILYENMLKETKENLNIQISKVENNLDFIQKTQDEQIKEIITKRDLIENNRNEQEEKLSKQFNSILQNLKEFELNTSKVIKDQKELESNLLKTIEDDGKFRKTFEKKLISKIENYEKDFKTLKVKVDNKHNGFDQTLKEFEIKLDTRTKAFEAQSKSIRELETKLDTRTQAFEAQSKSIRELETKLDTRTKAFEAQSKSIRELETKLDTRTKAFEAQSKSIRELEVKMDDSVKSSEARFTDIESKLKEQFLALRHQESQSFQFRKTIQVHEESSKSLTERVEGLKDIENRLSTKILKDLDNRLSSRSKEDEMKNIQSNQTQASHQASLEAVTQLTITVQETSQSLKDLQTEIFKKDQDQQTKIDQIQKHSQEALNPCNDRISKLESSLGKFLEEQQHLQQSPKVRVNELKTRKDTSHLIKDVSMRAPNEETRRQDLGVNSSRVPATPTICTSTTSQPPEPSNPSNPSGAVNPDHPTRPSSLATRHPSLPLNPNAHKPNSNLRIDTTSKTTPNHLQTTHMAPPTQVESSVNNTGFTSQQLDGVYNYLGQRLMNSNWLNEMIKTKLKENGQSEIKENIEKLIVKTKTINQVLSELNQFKVDDYLKRDDLEFLEIQTRFKHMKNLEVTLQDWVLKSKLMEQNILTVDQRCTEIVSKNSKENLSNTDVGAVQTGMTTLDKDLESKINNLIETSVKASISHELSKPETKNLLIPKSTEHLISPATMKPIQEMIKKNPTLPFNILRAFERHIIERMISLNSSEGRQKYERLVKVSLKVIDREEGEEDERGGNVDPIELELMGKWIKFFEDFKKITCQDRNENENQSRIEIRMEQLQGEINGFKNRLIPFYDTITSYIYEQSKPIPT